MYLDDGLCAVAGEQNALEASELVRSTLNKADFVAYPAKSKWEPTKHLQCLGFIVDLSLGQVDVPPEKINTLQAKLGQACKTVRMPARQLASIVGTLISMSLAIVPVSRLMARSFYALLESRTSWWDVLMINPEAQQELEFWEASLKDYSCQPICHSPSAVRVVYSDASDTDYGGFMVEHGTCISYGQWSAQETYQSSTWRELAAVWQLLLAMASKLANSRVC